ncbi:uncharacterized protein TERG_08638 [Trichophyton rubrum CBS 118892]|uniref:Uncharacterized protein n=1 Tax=Trichophyton rubrum (strain ATCC MYA-4607 / CBS 118892) TaxID=559305 RepID=F2T1E8_TRIRC|nr:uncharacterized protein TERG_08638 [Trichophyton rubrum CBS 118892]EGD92420.2 hypothetical protein TERG_08638 [Trichophyton rubrum CBS 118892]
MVLLLSYVFGRWRVSASGSSTSHKNPIGEMSFKTRIYCSIWCMNHGVSVWTRVPGRQIIFAKISKRIHLKAPETLMRVSRAHQSSISITSTRLPKMRSLCWKPLMPRFGHSTQPSHITKSYHIPSLPHNRIKKKENRKILHLVNGTSDKRSPIWRATQGMLCCCTAGSFSRRPNCAPLVLKSG